MRRFRKDIGTGMVMVRGEYMATGGVALRAYDRGEPYATVTICVPEIPLKDNEVILNHDILWNDEFTKSFIDQFCEDGMAPVRYGYADSYKVKLKDGWEDLCMTAEEFFEQ